MANTYAKTPRFRRNVNEPYIILVSKLAQKSSTIWVTFVRKSLELEPGVDWINL